METVEELSEYEQVVHFLMETTACDRVEARDWMMMENPLLGGVSPLQMIAMNKADHVIRFICMEWEMAGEA